MDHVRQALLIGCAHLAAFTLGFRTYLLQAPSADPIALTNRHIHGRLTMRIPCNEAANR